MESATMKMPRPHSRVRGRVWAVGVLLATIAAAGAAASPAAVAAPQSQAVTARQSHQVGGGSWNGAPVKVTWSVFPATAKGPDQNRQLFSYGVVKPGASVIDHVEIVNKSKQAAAFSLYTADASGTTPQGALLLEPPAKKPIDIGAWATFPGHVAQLSTVIPAHTAVIEQFTLAVPRLATPGDHTGGLVAAVSIPRKTKTGLGVLETYRIAVPMELRVPGALHAAVQVQSISTGFSDPLNPFGTGSATISYSVANTGNVRQSATQAVTVTGPFGQKSTIRPPKLPMILPGDSVRVAVAVPGLYPAGPMTGHVTITPGWPPQTIPIAGIVPVASGTASLFAVPWSLIGLILLLAAIGFGVWAMLRWRRRLHQAEIAAAASKASRATERRLLGSKSASANGNGARAKSTADTGKAESAPPSATQDSGSTPE
jgi:hypothetical protein